MLGVIVTNKLSLQLPRFSLLFFQLILGIIIFTAVNYYTTLVFSFPKGIVIGQILIVIFELFFIFRKRIYLSFIQNLKSLVRERLLLVCLFTIGAFLVALFNNHILSEKAGDLYTGESTYGDLPFHLSIISNIAFSNKFPPDNAMYSGNTLVYPYLINFFSAILVFEGWTLRQSIIIPGLILSFGLIEIMYEFVLHLTKSAVKSFLVVILYFFNGGLGFYFFLKDYSFGINSIIQALFNPSSLKEYSHLFEQNIQWGNFLSRMIVPERSLLFGIPAGLIILRLLFFRNGQKITPLELILISLLLSLMPLLHTHTVLTLAIIIPILVLFARESSLFNELKKFLIIVVMTLIFAIPHILIFFGHVSESNQFMKFNLGWMKLPHESFFWFWFKNTYLLVPLSLGALLLSKVNKQVKILQICALVLIVIINLFLFSPYNWDNVKFLFWAGLFFDITASFFLISLFQKRSLFLKVLVIIIIFSMVSSALLSLWREINVKYVLFSKEAVSIGEQIRLQTPPDSVFLTYKVHNSPVTNLAGRSILMGYPGLLWVHGINYQERENDINHIFAGFQNAKSLIKKYNINYIVVESYNPEGMFINRNFFDQYPILLKSQNYTIHKIE